MSSSRPEPRTEFIEGAARLKGSAKALDVWRMECKIELLLLGLRDFSTLWMIVLTLLLRLAVS